MLTRQVPKYQTARSYDVQLALDPIGVAFCLLDRAIRGETKLPATNNLLEEADWRHVRQTGPKLDDEDEHPKHGDYKSRRAPLPNLLLLRRTVHSVACRGGGTVVVAGQSGSARRALGVSRRELLDGMHYGFLMCRGAE
jgi:hypothetical protein